MPDNSTIAANAKKLAKKQENVAYIKLQIKAATFVVVALRKDGDRAIRNHYGYDFEIIRKAKRDASYNRISQAELVKIASTRKASMKKLLEEWEAKLEEKKKWVLSDITKKITERGLTLRDFSLEQIKKQKLSRSSSRLSD